MLFMAFMVDMLQKAIGPIIGILVSSAIVWALAHRELLGTAFFGRITFSYVGIAEGSSSTKDDPGAPLTIETLLDEQMGQVWLDNRVLRGRVISAAKQSSVEDPLLRLQERDLYHVISGLRHKLSERYSEGIVDRALGFPVRKEELLICLCFSASKESKTPKLRAMVLKQETLKAVGDNPEAFAAANTSRPTLVQTVLAVHKQWIEEKKTKDDAQKLVSFVRIYRRE